MLRVTLTLSSSLPFQVRHGLGLDFKTTVINADLLDTTAVVDAYKVNRLFRGVK